MKKAFKTISTISLFVALAACNKPRATRQQETKQGSESLLELPKSKNQGLEVLYAVKLKLEGLPSPCSGRATLRVASNFSISFPENEQNTLSCFGFLEFSLSELLGGITTVSSGSSGSDKPSRPLVEHDGDMLYLSRLSKADFTPARPFLLGPVITNTQKYKNYRNETETIATVNGKAYEGKFIVDVNAVDVPYQSPANPQMRFANTINWETRAEGFDGMNKVRGLAFSRFGWIWSTSPIMIPRMYFEVKASDILGDSQKSLSNISDTLFGKVTVDLNVISYDELANE